MTQYQKLRAWQKEKIKQVEESGAEMFMGIPDRWYEKPTYGCENGHISHNYLKSEAVGANLCFDCFKPIVICPPETTEEELQQILS